MIAPDLDLAPETGFQVSSGSADFCQCSLGRPGASRASAWRCSRRLSPCDFMKKKVALNPRSRQDFIRIPSPGCNQNRAGSRGMPRESIPPATPAPTGPNGGYRRSQARAGQRNTTGESERAESESQFSRNVRPEDSACSLFPQLGRQAWCISSLQACPR